MTPQQAKCWIPCRRRSGVPALAEEVPQWLFAGEPLADAELAQVAREIDGALWHSMRQAPRL